VVTGSSVYARYAQWVNAGTATERTSFFSDAVFAIAMTLLAVQIHVPTVEPGHLAEALREQVPEYFAYTLSFVVVGAFWMSHHRLFRLLERYNATLQRLNLLALMFVALVGYGTGVIATYGNETAGVIVYAVIISAVGLTHSILWQYAWSRQLLSEDVDPGLFGYIRARSLVVPVVFLASIPLALFSPSGAKYLWLAVLAVDVALVVVYKRRPATTTNAKAEPTPSS
jgi:uncharacterized membrane protein